jgi:hypothetical protein
MNHRRNSSKSGHRVDWNDPDLQSLLSKTEHWKLDNRAGHVTQDVQIQVGWGVGADKPAVLVWERDKTMVLEASFDIPVGERVRVDRLLDDGMRSVWGVVADGREGRREGDREHGVRVYWVHVR